MGVGEESVLQKQVILEERLLFGEETDGVDVQAAGGNAGHEGQHDL